MVEAAQLGPLTGLRVLEIGHFIAAPFGTRLLGDLGADVIKIEPLSGDPVRQWGIHVDGHSPWWSQHARNKRCITLDLTPSWRIFVPVNLPVWGWGRKCCEPHAQIW